ncbi:exodeoxyribonuclease V subunit alpha [Reinekea marina]|uniref:RecBCD enzyme subunit RecD n=1 Tax=Reinekea marina TaxID=1310421 RepID=A0ABV7WQT4_9GAMM|nr:exodeoxyribonuclease V subunit alpha [Reinekea marina]MDN3648194.1 exodeoxyribonuclease V subunit alpha [Reinekea marina]
MMNNQSMPFQPIDIALAKRVCQWHNATNSQLLMQSVLATSFALQQGHTCLSLKDCLQESPFNEMESFGFQPFPATDDWMAALSEFNLDPNSQSPIILHNQRLYLRRYFQFETEVLNFFKRHNQRITLDSKQAATARQYLNDFFAPSAEIDWQRAAAINALFSQVSLITGGPGTGKTYTVTRILATLVAISPSMPLIQLAAPTGKAAQRLAESIREAKQSMSLDLFVGEAIPDEATTIHRLLGVIPNSIHFKHDENNPINADILLIDEASMIDLPLMARLVRAIKPSTQVIFLGDADQLPSVAAGSVLTDLIERPHPGYSPERVKALAQFGIETSEISAQASTFRDDLTELKRSRRFDGGSGIGKLAKAILNGQPQPGITLFETQTDLEWLSTPLDKALKQWTAEYYRDLPSQRSLSDAFLQLKQFRILCAHREGEQGVEAINETISKQLNINRQPFYKGQPIMVTQNHYGLKLFNGDIGLVWPNESGQLMVWFESLEGYRAVAPGRLPSHETVFAMTIHKTQGSEFSHVAMVLPDAASAIVTRELIYTGLTRAKNAFTLVASSAVWKQGITNQVHRWAGLSSRLNQNDLEEGSEKGSKL